MSYIEIGKRLLTLPGVTIAYDAQKDMLKYDYKLGTQFESVPLDDPTAEVYTHYLTNPGDLSDEDEHDLSYYNACAYGEETSTLDGQKQLVRDRFGGAA